ncbi:MAG: hypothetical protein JWO53_1077 [Chlamydiia bacterium]|nr:hypothetical protein [Chlamydiia bacterium]
MVSIDFIATENTETEKLNFLSGKIIGAAIEVHRVLGPGLLESAYEACLVYELKLMQLNVDQQKLLPVFYKGTILDNGYRLDLVVESQVIIEVKAINSVLPVHKAQLLSYLKLSGCKVGLLINFNEQILKKGIHRMRL